MLEDWLRESGQDARGQLSNAHLLAEAERVWEESHIDESGTCDGYHPSAVTALRRYIDRLRSIGVKPAHDFDV